MQKMLKDGKRSQKQNKNKVFKFVSVQQLRGNRETS